jgi:hypothetical protein
MIMCQNCKCQKATSPVRKLMIGDVVRALVVITDEDNHGVPYLHAVPGTWGIVIDATEPSFPNVSWDLSMRGGVCNVPASKVEVIDTPRYDVCG